MDAAGKSRDEVDWDRLVQGLVAGDDRAYSIFWDLFGKRLEGLARKHFPRGLARRLGPEDLVQSACRSFYRRATAGELALSDGESLWGLLCGITLNKLKLRQRFHLAGKRALNRERDVEGGSPAAPARPAEAASAEQLPDESAMFAEQLESVMGLLDPLERNILQLKLDGYTNDEISERVGRAERTVRRVLTRLREKLEGVLLDDLRPPDRQG